MKKQTLNATLAASSLLILSACGPKPPDCNDPDVVSAVTQEATQQERNTAENAIRRSITRDPGWQLMMTASLGRALNKSLHAEVNPSAMQLHPQFNDLSKKMLEAAPDAPVRFVVDTTGVLATLSNPIQVEKNTESALSVCEFRQANSGKLIATLDVKNLFMELTADKPTTAEPDAKTELAKLEGVVEGAAVGELSKEQREALARESFDKLFGFAMTYWLKFDATYDSTNLAAKRTYEIRQDSTSVKYNVQRNKEGKLSVSYIEPPLVQKQ